MTERKPIGLTVPYREVGYKEKKQNFEDALSRAIWDRMEVEALLLKLTGVKWIPKENTPQPKQEWVELTDEELSALAEQHTGADGLDEVDFGRAVMRAFKENNT